MIKFIAPLLLIAFFLSGTLKASKPVRIISPNGHLVMTVSNPKGENGMLFYKVDFKGNPIVLNSELGITGWVENMEIGKVTQRIKDTTWHPVYGERAKVRDHFSEKTITIKQKGTPQKLQLIVRAYNEGIAFRYFFPTDSNHGDANIHIDQEKTTFVVPTNTMAWVAYRAQSEHYLLPVKDWKDLADRPLTIQLESGLYASLAEAEMVDYSRTKFKTVAGEQNIIRCAMDSKVDRKAPFGTPWRVVMVAERPADLLANNDLILNLNPPCVLEKNGWIKPGRIIRSVSLTTAGAKQVVDFAVTRKLDYIHLDAGWYGAETSAASNPTKSDVDPARSKINDLNVPEVVNYAKSKGIRVWLYVNQIALKNYLDEILPLYESWGIAGIKFGFVNVGSQEWTAWLHEAVRKCADHHLLVDIHDEYRPTGFSRTYPNLLTQEGVRGNEEFPDGRNNTILPFTRYIAGAGDYTICYFHRKELKANLAKSMNARSLINTSGHQMALSVINYSPLQFLYWYDAPEDVQNVPELEFFDQLPTVWDDTKIIDGKISEYIILARQKGDKWYVAGITNNEKRTMKLSFDFLESGKTYELVSYTDDGEQVQTPTHVKIDKQMITNQTTVVYDVLPRGGFALTVREL